MIVFGRFSQHVDSSCANPHAFMYNIVTDLSTATLINAFKGGVRELANINDIQSRVFPQEVMSTERTFIWAETSGDFN